MRNSGCWLGGGLIRALASGRRRLGFGSWLQLPLRFSVRAVPAPLEFRELFVPGSGIRYCSAGERVDLSSGVGRDEVSGAFAVRCEEGATLGVLVDGKLDLGSGMFVWKLRLTV